MPSFATAADMGRPVPRADGGVATARPALDGGEAANALYRQGAETKEFAAALDKATLELEQTSAQDALNKLRLKRQELTLDPEKGFTRIKGGDVLKKGASGQALTDELPAGFQQASDHIGSGLWSPRARAMYQQAAATEAIAFKRDLVSHMMGETEKYRGAVYNETNALILNEAVSAGGDTGKLDVLAARAETAAINRARELGLPAEATVAGARSNVFRAAIEGMAAANNGAGALALFYAAGDKLDAKDKIELRRQLKSVETGQIARNYVADLNVDEVGRRDAVIKALTSADGTTPALSPAVAAGFAANFFKESRFRTSALNPGDGRDGSDSINIGQWNGPRAIALRQFAAKNGLDLSDPMTGVKYARAELEGDIPQGVSGITPEQRERIKAAKTPEEAGALISRLFFRPRDTEGEASSRGQTAATFLTEYQRKNDPLAASVNAASGAAPKEGPAGFLDTRKAMIDAELWHIEATKRNAEDWAADPTQAQANQSRIDVQFNQRKAGIQLAKDQLNNAVQDWVTKPGPDGRAQTERPPPAIWNQLSYQQQRSIDATLAHNAKGADVVTDQELWYEIQRGLTSSDPAIRAQWASEPLWQFKGKLSVSDFQELAKMQGAARKGDPDKELSQVGSVNQLVDRTLTTLGIDPTPKPSTSPTSDAGKAAAFRRAVQDDLTVFEKQKGHKATPEEQQKIIDRLTREVAGTGGWFSANKRVFQMKIDDVPKEERAKIEDALKRRGQPPTDAMIIELYTRKNAKP